MYVIDGRFHDLKRRRVRGAPIYARAEAVGPPLIMLWQRVGGLDRRVELDGISTLLARTVA
jgi:hypothetical protein